MLKDSPAFSSFSVDDIQKAKAFYGDTLELDVSDTAQGLNIHIPGGGDIFVYAKPNHQPASFTVLNFPVNDIDEAVDELISKGINFEHYSGERGTDDKGVLRGLEQNQGPDIAWFKDPCGNVLSVLQTDKNEPDEPTETTEI